MQVWDTSVQVCDVPMLVAICLHSGVTCHSPVQVCSLGKRVKEDLLTVVRWVQDCYPPHMDILNLYAGLYHCSFSACLSRLAACGLGPEDCMYLLFWINRCYPE